jgi:ABC-type hemin transport system ATPase subunit
VSKESKDVRKSSLEILSKLGISLKEGKTFGIYGLSMVGKSVLSAIIARDWVGDNGTVVVFGTESHYADEDYRGLIARFLPKTNYINYCHNIEDVYKYMNIVRRKSFEGRVALILDSLSFIAIRETAEWNLKGVTEPRVIVARVIPVLYTVAAAFKSLVIEKHGIGIMAMHAGTMAGTGKFRGITDYKPSMAGRVAHSLDYLMLMESEGPTLEAPRKLTLVMSRLNPLDEGKVVKVKFVGNTVEEVRE